uniref:Uncharacterized protein n=1 Tax=Nonomuraea gerenzanensis TaxID=93944 RepID=A0A1M4EPI4_9ACTN|nr:hypothetical protein BN4615_P10245 [Nonomuraea gerenzanensis]
MKAGLPGPTGGKRPRFVGPRGRASPLASSATAHPGNRGVIGGFPRINTVRSHFHRAVYSIPQR